MSGARRGQHIELSMLDSVVSFLWADAAGNEVLTDVGRHAEVELRRRLRAVRVPRRLGDLHADLRCRLRRDVPCVRCRWYDVDAIRDDRRSAGQPRGEPGGHGPLLRGRGDDDHALRRWLALEAETTPCGQVLTPAELVDRRARRRRRDVRRDRSPDRRSDASAPATPPSSPAPRPRSAEPARRSASTPTRSSPELGRNADEIAELRAAAVVV